MNRIFVPKGMEVVIASHGGVGTTFLMRYIAKYLIVNNFGDHDGLKHSSIPPIAMNKNVKYVYVFGDPVEAVMSLFRRNLQERQSKKLEVHTHRSRVPLGPHLDIEAYAAAAIDRFHFRTHFFNWYHTYLVHPTLFLRYESVFENVSELTRFLDLPDYARSTFPKKAQRESTVSALAPEVFQGLGNMYGEFKRELDSLGDAEVRIPGEVNRFYIYLKDPYRRAIVSQALDFRSRLKTKAPGLFETTSIFKHWLTSLFSDDR